MGSSCSNAESGADAAAHVRDTEWGTLQAAVMSILMCREVCPITLLRWLLSSCRHGLLLQKRLERVRLVYLVWRASELCVSLLHTQPATADCQ